MTIETKIPPIKLLKARSSELYTMYNMHKYSLINYEYYKRNYENVKFSFNEDATMAISILMRYNNCITDLRSQMLHKK